MGLCCMTRGSLSSADSTGEQRVLYLFLLEALLTVSRTSVFDDTYILELAVNAYYSQISHFTVDV